MAKVFSNPARDYKKLRFRWKGYRELLKREAKPILAHALNALPEQSGLVAPEVRRQRRAQTTDKLNNLAISEKESEIQPVLESYMQEYLCAAERAQATNLEKSTRYDNIEASLLLGEKLVGAADYRKAVFALKKVEKWLATSNVGYDEMHPALLVVQAQSGQKLNQEMLDSLLERVCLARAQMLGIVSSRPKTVHDHLFVCQLASVYGYDFKKDKKTDRDFIAFCIGAYKALGIEKTSRQIEGLVKRYHDFKMVGGKWILTDVNGNTEV